MKYDDNGLLLSYRFHEEYDGGEDNYKMERNENNVDALLWERLVFEGTAYGKREVSIERSIRYFDRNEINLNQYIQ